MLLAAPHIFAPFLGEQSMAAYLLSRRNWIKVASAAASSTCLISRGRAAGNPRPKVAAVFTEFRVRSHAFHILTSLMGKYLFRGQWIDPGVDVVSF